MTESRIKDSNSPLNESALELLSSAIEKAGISCEQRARLRERILARIEEDTASLTPYITVRENEGSWIKISPLVDKKVLHVDGEAGIESFLLRLKPGGALDPHRHHGDEYCVVLEGDMSFDGQRLHAGDFHLARKGSRHGRASTVNGALLYIQSALPTGQRALTS